MINSKKITQKLHQLEKRLIDAQLWSDKYPSPEQLASQEPFCVDTMAFEEWLQWICIPKLKTLVAQPHFNGLPNRSDIHTMADYVFKEYQAETNKITKTIKEIDNLLNESGE